MLHALDLFLQFLHSRRQFLGLLHSLGGAPFQRKEKRVNYNRKKNDCYAVTAGQAVKSCDGPKNRNGQRARQPSQPTIIDQSFQIDRTANYLTDLVAGGRQEVMVFWANIDDGMRTSRTNRHKACHQVSLFRFAVSLKVVLYGTVLETIGSPVRHGHQSTGPLRTRRSGLFLFVFIPAAGCRSVLSPT